MKWRLKVKADVEEKSDVNGLGKEAASNGQLENENEDDAIEEQIKEAVYNEKKIDKKLVLKLSGRLTHD